MPEAYPHPELEATAPVYVAEAAHRLLAADPPLQAYATGGIVEAEIEDLIYLGTVIGPMVATVVEAIDEVRDGGSHQALLSTLLRHFVVEQVAADTGVRRHLRTRAIERIKRVLVQPSEHDPGGAGVLVYREDDGTVRPVTDYLERFQRVPTPRWLSAEHLLVTSAQSLWVTSIDLVTREYR